MEDTSKNMLKTEKIDPMDQEIRSGLPNVPNSDLTQNYQDILLVGTTSAISCIENELKNRIENND